MNKKHQLKKWIKTWEKAGYELCRLRNEDIINSNTQKTIESLDSAFKSAILHSHPKPESGLVDLQKLLQRTQI
jgi:thiaminase